MGGAALTANVSHLVLYEPSFGLTYPPGAIEAIESAVAAGDPETAIRAALVDTGAMTDDEFERLQGGPPVAEGARRGRHPPPGMQRRGTAGSTSRASSTGSAAPTLLLTGSDTGAEMAACTQRAAAAIPNSQIRVLDGHAHFAFKTDPAMVAAIIRDHISSS